MRITAVVARAFGSDEDALALTQASVADRVDEIRVVSGEDVGARRTEAVIESSAHRPGAIVLALEAGEVVVPAAWEAIAAFAKGESAVGRVGLLERRGDEHVRHVVPRLVRAYPAARFVGRCVDRPVVDGAAEHV